MQIDRSILYFRTIKSLTGIAYIFLIWLTFRFITHETHIRIAIGAIVLSALWLLITKLQMTHFLKTYFDVLSRLEVVIPATLGITLSILPLILRTNTTLHIIAIIELLLWIAICITYRKNRINYIKQGHGPLPAFTWVSPPETSLKPGDLILTSGRVAAGLRESVGHAEMVIEIPDNSMKAFSSYMANGIVLNSLSETASNTLKQGHYIVLRLKQPFTDEQIKQSAQIAYQMQKENQEWKDKRNERRKKFISILPLPLVCKQKLISLFYASGYDWLGLFMGRLAKQHWTCIGACLELYRRLGIRTKDYGTGIFGLGSGLLDPIMPVRFLDDPTFQLLTKNDKGN
jgi:hypothetical protein